MTGTAKTEEKEFVEIYDLHVVEIPTNQPVARLDENDYIFKTPEAKFAAVLDDIVERHEAGQPVLVGTIAVETSEYLSELLKRKGIPHNVLNAKEHEREGEIIKDAGQRGAVTIATNMAGRGVDIKLGEGVVDLGGLYVLGTERHESRRIDNQLRGRSGRQGDPGETRFYLSGQDDLVRLFAGDRIYNIMNRFKIPDDQPMEASILSKQIENAQKKVEEQNFVARKNVLKYDDVMNTQRMVIYEQRRRVLEGEDLSDEVREWIREVVEAGVAQATDSEFAEDWDLDGLVTSMQSLYGTDITVEELREELDVTSRDELVEEFVDDALETYDEREQALGAGARARGRALHHPPDRRRALARAPRGDGLPPRGRPPPRVRPEGSARRVPRRGPCACSRSSARRSARRSSSRSSTSPYRSRSRRSSRCRPARARSTTSTRRRRRRGDRRRRCRRDAAALGGDVSRGDEAPVASESARRSASAARGRARPPRARRSWPPPIACMRVAASSRRSRRAPAHAAGRSGPERVERCQKRRRAPRPRYARREALMIVSSRIAAWLGGAAGRGLERAQRSPGRRFLGLGGDRPVPAGRPYDLRSLTSGRPVRPEAPGTLGRGRRRRQAARRAPGGDRGPARLGP